MSINKTIHYCWFGRGQKSEIIIKCIESWKKYAPDWKIIEWNEDNYDINKNKFIKSAYEAKRWAFVSDYARLDILLNYGGVYLDTDVEILCENPFDKYEKYDNVLAFETARAISSGLFFLSKPGSALCQKLIEPYNDLVFDTDNLPVNSFINKPIIEKFFPTLKYNNQTQEMKNCLIISSVEYGALMKHYGTRSWCENLPKYKVSKDNWLKRVLRNPKIFETFENNKILRKILPLYTFLSYDLLDLGPIFYIKLKLNNRKANKKQGLK